MAETVQQNQRCHDVILLNGVPFLEGLPLPKILVSFRGNPYCNSPTSRTSQRKQIPGGWRCPSSMGWDRKPPWGDVWSRGSSEAWWCCGVFFIHSNWRNIYESFTCIWIRYDNMMQYASFWNDSNKTAVYTLIVGIRSRFFPVIHQSHGQSQAPEVWNEKTTPHIRCAFMFSIILGGTIVYAMPVLGASKRLHAWWITRQRRVGTCVP